MSVVGKIVNALTGDVLGKILDIVAKAIPDPNQRAATEAELKSAMAESAAKTEQAWAGAAADMFRAAQATITASPALQRALAAMVVLQTVVLLWYQIGAPAYQEITGRPWPEPGVTLEWAYGLLLAQMGIAYKIRQG